MSISFWPAIQQIAGGSGGSPTAINRDSQWTIVTVDTTSDQDVELPAGADVGDVVEVYYVNGNAAIVHAPSGESLIGGGTLNAPRVFRKIDTSLWGYFR